MVSGAELISNHREQLSAKNRELLPTEIIVREFYSVTVQEENFNPWVLVWMNGQGRKVDMFSLGLAAVVAPRGGIAPEAKHASWLSRNELASKADFDHSRLRT